MGICIIYQNQLLRRSCNICRDLSLMKSYRSEQLLREFGMLSFYEAVRWSDVHHLPHSLNLFCVNVLLIYSDERLRLVLNFDMFQLCFIVIYFSSLAALRFLFRWFRWHLAHDHAALFSIVLRWNFEFFWVLSIIDTTSLLIWDKIFWRVSQRSDRRKVGIFLNNLEIWLIIS